MWITGFTNDIEVIAERCYLIQLNPELTPTWYKFGFTKNLRHRFGSIKTTNPKCVLIGSWFSLPAWELLAAKAIVEDLKVEKVGGEVYAIQDIKGVVRYLSIWFAHPPKLYQKKDRQNLPLFANQNLE